MSQERCCWPSSRSPCLRLPVLPGECPASLPTGVHGCTVSWAVMWISGITFLQGAQNTLNSGILNHPGSWQNFGIIAGALLAALLASQFKFKKIKSLKQVVAATLGGLLMGYGARLAGGCNIGALFSAIGSMSLSGWVFAFFLFIGAFIGSKLLARFFM